MPIISKETWDKFTQEEKEKIQKDYKNNLEEINNDDSEADIEYKTYVSAAERYFGKENLQPKPLTYEDVARELFKEGFYFIDCNGKATYINSLSPNAIKEPNNCTSEKQAEKLLAINRLLNVAKFLNKDWKPEWSNDEDKWSLCVDPDTNKVRTIKVYHSEVNRYVAYFRTEELAKQAVTILGEDTIRLALSSDY